MTNENSFDKYVKDSLQDYKSPVPEGLWDKIIEDKRIDKAAPFWKNKYVIASIITVCIFSFSALYFNYSLNKNRAKELTVTDKKQKIKANPVYVDNKIVTKNLAFITNNSISDSSGNTNIPKNVIANVAISHIKYSKSKESIVTSAAAIQSFKLRLKVNTTPTNSIGMNHKTILIKNGFKINNKVQNNNFPKTKNDILYSSRPLNSTDSSEESNHFEKGTLISFRHPLNDNEIVSNEALSNHNNLTVIHVPDLLNKSWYLSLYASPDLNSQKIQNTLASNTFSKLQDSTQRVTNGITAGMELSRTYGNHWKFKTGLQFKQVNERFFYIQNNALKNISVTTNRSYITNQGTTVFAVDTTFYQQPGFTIKTIFNSYKSIELPLTLGYEGRIDKLSIAFNAGLVTTLATFYEGKTNDSSQNIIPLGATHTNGFYRSVSSFSLYGSAELIYPIGHNLDVFAEPYYRYGLTNNSVSSIGYNKKYNTAGAFFGLRYHFISTGNK